MLAVSALVFIDLHHFDLRMPGAVFIAGAAIAVIVAAVEHQQAEGLEELRFRQLTETAAERIREKTAIYSNVTRGAASLFAVTDHVKRADWRDYVASLTVTERYPGIAGLGIVAPVEPDQLDQFIAQQRADGAPDFSVRAVPGVGAHPRVPVDEHFVVQTIEPAAQNVGVLGTDVATEISRREAALAARDSGLPAISGPIVLISDVRRRLGFHLYIAIYDTPTPPHSIELRRAHFRGWVLGRFVIQDFFDSALMPLGDNIVAEVFDGDEIDAGKLLMATWATWGAVPGQTDRRIRTTLSLAGHPFTIQWHAGPGFVRHEHGLMAMTGSFLAVLATLLAALVANLQSLRHRATTIAERMTGELTASNERFELAIAGSQDGIWDWDLNSRRLWGSPRCRQILGYEETALPDEPAAWRSLMLPEDQVATRAAFARVRSGEAPNFDVIQRYRHRDGHIVHVHNQASAVRDKQGRLTRLVGALTDITPLVKAQEQLRAAISVMKDGFGLFDADDRIVLHNEPFIDEGTRKALGNNLVGRKFEEILRAFAYHGGIGPVGADFDAEVWIAQRMERHRNPPTAPIEVQWSENRWMRISERRTSDGGYVGIWTDITAVKLAEQRLLAAIDSMADGFALFDAEDRLVCYNKGFMDGSLSRNFPDPRGHTFEEIIRVFAYDDVTAVPVLLDRETWIRQRIERHRNPSDEPFEQQTTDGKWFRVFERRTADGGCLGIWTDISALKNAEARVRDAIESINEGFALLDADLRFVMVNSNFVGMYPVSGKLAVPGARLEDMLRHGAEHGEYPGIDAPRQVNEFVALWMERFMSGDRYLGEGEMPDGSWFLVSHHPTASGGYVSIRADITAQKRREAALSAAMSDLEVKTLELGVLADELEQARRAADLANLGKSQFLANMTHELRTPLNAINGFSEIILKEMFGPMPERYKGYVEFIQQGGAHLLSLINDILDLSKIEAGKMDMHVEAVPTEQVAYQAIESLRKAADERRLTLRSDIAADCPILHADQRAVRQILLNLMSNAVKFTPHFGTVTLSVRRAAT
ncbi:MAG: PAS domain S-box protein, partial [Rhodospirillaceae bacterium]|nr:PAS domain S-box protein [Rhodospirillaceae bacterium]